MWDCSLGAKSKTAGKLADVFFPRGGIDGK